MKKIILLLMFVSSNLFADNLNYKYDSSGKLIEISENNGLKIIYIYDANGNIISSSVSGQKENNKDSTNNQALLSAIFAILD